LRIDACGSFSPSVQAKTNVQPIEDPMAEESNPSATTRGSRRSNLLPVIPVEERIDLSSPYSRWWKILLPVLAIAIFCGNAICVALGNAELTYMGFYSSEGVIDSLGGMLAALACALFAACWWRSRGDDQSEASAMETPIVGWKVARGRPGRRWMYLFFAIVCLGMAGEEFSWGGRLATASAQAGGWGPDFSWSRFVQPKDARLPLAMTYWAAFFLFWGWFLPGLAHWSGRFARFASLQRLPIPSLFLSRVWMVVAIISLDLTFNYFDLLARPEDLYEAFETAMELLIAAWAWEEYSRVRSAAGAGRSRVLTGVIVALVAGSMGVIAYDLAYRGLPASRAQRIFQRGLAASERKESESAIALFREALIEYRLHDAAQYALGIELNSRGRLPEAITCFENAVRIAPGVPDYHIALATAYVNVMTGPSIRAAIPHLDEAIRLLRKEDERYAQVAELRGSVEEIRQLSERVVKNPEMKAKLDALTRKPGESAPPAADPNP
jgi:hypothetical protein